MGLALLECIVPLREKLWEFYNQHGLTELK